jgi:hypothetical protein
VFDPRKRDVPELSIDFLLDERNAKERQRLFDMTEKVLPRIKCEDNLFQKFEQLQKKVDETLKNDPESREMKQVWETYTQLQLGSLANRWAFWLNEVDELVERDHKGAMAAYHKFENRVWQDYAHDRYKLIRDHTELMKWAIALKDAEEYDQAQKVFIDVILRFPEVSAFAHYFLGIIGLHNQRDTGLASKQKAKRYFKQSLVLLEAQRADIFSRSGVLIETNRLAFPDRGERMLGQFQIQAENEGKILTVFIEQINQAIGSTVTSEIFTAGAVTNKQCGEILACLKQAMCDSLPENFSNDEGPQHNVPNIPPLLPTKEVAGYEQNLAGRRCVLKDFRLSKKVRFLRGDGGVVLMLGKAQLPFPAQFEYCKDKVFERLQAITGARKCDRDLFDSCVYGLEDFKEDTNSIIDVTKKYFFETNVEEKLQGKLETSPNPNFDIFLGKGEAIKRLLSKAAAETHYITQVVYFECVINIFLTRLVQNKPHYIDRTIATMPTIHTILTISIAG